MRGIALLSSKTAKTHESTPYRFFPWPVVLGRRVNFKTLRTSISLRKRHPQGGRLAKSDVMASYAAMLQATSLACYDTQIAVVNFRKSPTMWCRLIAEVIGESALGVRTSIRNKALTALPTDFLHERGTTLRTL